MAAQLFKAGRAGLGISLRVTPRASRTAIDGIAEEADGGQALKVAVTAPPDDGKANDAVIRLLAKEWRLPKTTLSIASGATSRRKTVMIAGDARALETTITNWLKQHGCA